MFVYLFLAVTCVYGAKDSFTEELLLKPLYGNKLYAHFQFVTKWFTDDSPESLYNTHLFPRALSEIIIRHNVQELHISLTAGLWRYETWGYPVIDAAPGAEVWAWFKPGTTDVDKNWKELTNSLSGLLCASLNFMDNTNSISPEVSFRPSGIVKEAINSTLLRYSSLPREIVCTENLTPWKKLLPCDSKAGLATLLNAGYIHNTQYHSVGMQFRPICGNADCTESALELRETVSLLYDYTILGTKSWTLRKLFGQGILNTCPLAESSNIYVDISSNSTKSNQFTLTPSPDKEITSQRGGHTNLYAVYNVKNVPMTIQSTFTGNDVKNYNIPPPLHVNMYKTGYGQQKGGIVTKVYNNHWGELEIVVLKNIPWYVPIYLHSMKIISNGNNLKPIKLRYIPGGLRTKYHQLEINLVLPAKSTTSISINFDFVFLKWQEYPPDANHGFYIGSAVVSAMLPLARNFTGVPQDGSTIADSFNASRSGYLIQLRTETLIITLPTPDFSMPYNVICLACTVVALAFGPLHNITTKRLILKVIDKESILSKIKRGINKLRKPKERTE